jgi:hypothetical protein
MTASLCQGEFSDDISTEMMRRNLRLMLAGRNDPNEVYFFLSTLSYDLLVHAGRQANVVEAFSPSDLPDSPGCAPVCLNLYLNPRSPCLCGLAASLHPPADLADYALGLPPHA